MKVMYDIIPKIKLKFLRGSKLVRTTDSRRNSRNETQHNRSSKWHKVIAIVMAAVLVLIVVAGLYILNREGKIDIAWLNNSSGQSTKLSTPAPLENAELFTMEPEITPEKTPEPTKKIYIPDINELQELPDPATIRLTENMLDVEITAEVSVVSWDEYKDASYYVLAIYNSKYEEVQKDILWSNITTWQVPSFTSGKVILYVYKDAGEDGVEDDKIVDIYSHEILPVDGEEISFSPTRNKYYLLVDKESFAIGVFTYDESGEYNKLLYTFPCALGESDRMTTVGVWEISSKGPWKLWSTGWYSPYYCRFTAGLYIHGAVYAKDQFSTMSPTSYEKIGTKSTSGCIRTTVEGAEWIYYNCPAGTIIEIVDSSDLLTYPGKPAVDPDYTNWDPTDPNKPGNKS